MNLGMARAQTETVDEAHEAITKLRQVDPTLRVAHSRLNALLRRPEDRTKIIEGLRLAGLPE